jgi:hypothetical protein
VTSKRMQMRRRAGEAVATIERRDFALALGVGASFVLVWGLSGSIDVPRAERLANDASMFVFTEPVALPRTVELAYGELQRPANDNAQSANAAGAVWKYLCTRTPDLAQAAGTRCPEFDMGSIGLGALTPPAAGEDEDLDQKYAATNDNTVVRGWRRQGSGKPEEGQLP